MTAIFKREFKSYMRNMTGPIFITFMLLFTGACIAYYNLLYIQASFQNTMFYTAYVFVIAVPLIAMRTLAEDKNGGTDKLLFSLPITSSQIVLGKYFAALAVFAIPTALMAIYPIILSLYGHMFYLTAYTSLLALLFLGAALMAICMFISSLTENAIISMVLGIGTMLFLALLPKLTPLLPSAALLSYICLAAFGLLIAFVAWKITKNATIGIVVAALIMVPLVICFILFREAFEGLFPKILSYLSLYDRFAKLNSGVFDIRGIIYFISVAVFFLFLSRQSLEKRRWN